MIKPIQSLRLLILLALLLSCGACGYHLRGDISLDSRYLPLSIEDSGGNTQIKPRLIRRLTESRIDVDSKTADGLRIILTREKFEKNLVSAAEEAKTYEISYRVYYQFDVDGKQVLNNQELRLNRTLQFSNSAVVSSATEEATLRDDLLDDAAFQIVTRLRYLDVLIEEYQAEANEPKT